MIKGWRSVAVGFLVAAGAGICTPHGWSAEVPAKAASGEAGHEGEKSDFRKKTEVRIRSIDRDIAALRERVVQLDEEQRQRMNRDLAKLEKQRHELEQRLGALKEKGDRKFEDVQRKVESSLAEIERGIRRAFSGSR